MMRLSRGLPEDFGQARHRQLAAADQIGQHLARSRPTATDRHRRRGAAPRARAAPCSTLAISGTSTIETSSRTRRSQSSARSAPRRKPPSLGSNSSRRWMVLASRPVLSDSRLAARPVGAASNGSTPLALRMARMERMIVVLPTPGPPVRMSSFEAERPAHGLLLARRQRHVEPPSTQAMAFSASMAGQGGRPTRSLRMAAAMAYPRRDAGRAGTRKDGHRSGRRPRTLRRSRAPSPRPAIALRSRAAARQAPADRPPAARSRRSRPPPAAHRRCRPAPAASTSWGCRASGRARRRS